MLTLLLFFVVYNNSTRQLLNTSTHTPADYIFALVRVISMVIIKG